MTDSRLKLSPIAAVRRATIGFAGGGALLGLAVMISWHLNLLRLVQILPDSAPMQYNTALALLLCGSGVVGVVLGWRRVGLALAALVALLGLLTLSQYLFDVNLGLDQLFIKSTLMYKTSHPGRMAPLAAFCFTLIGTALGLRCLSGRFGSLLAASSLSAMVLALASSVLLVYVFELREPVFQFQFTRMAVHTAAGLLLLAAGVYLLGWGEAGGEARWLRQVITPLTICSLTATLYLWAALKAQEQSKITRETGLLANVVKNGLEVRTNSTGQALERLAQRWNFAGGMPRTAWEVEAANYEGLEGALAMVWANPAHHVQGVVPLKDNAAAQGHDLGEDERRREVLEQASRLRALAVSRSVELVQGGKGFILCVPVFRRGQSDGHILLVMRAQGFLASVANRHKQDGDTFALFDDQEEISHLGTTDAAGPNEYRSEVVVQLAGTRLRLVVQPGQARIAAASSALPSVVFWGGLLLNILLALLARQTHTARQRARELDTLVEQLRRETDEHRQSEERFRAVVEAAPSAMLCVNEEGRITLANAQAERLFGYARAGLVGQPVEMLVPERFRSLHALYPPGFFNQMGARALGLNHEFYALRSDGSELPIESDLNQLAPTEGCAVLISISDISERKQVELALLMAKEAAEQATRAKSLFLANMSHEIRTPLNGVIGMTSLLQQTELTARQSEFTETIRASGEALLAVINDILVFSKIESGRLDLEELPFDPRACVDEVLAMLALKAGEKGLALACLSDLPPGLTVRGDEARLNAKRQVRAPRPGRPRTCASCWPRTIGSTSAWRFICSN